MEARDIYHKMRAIAEPIHAYSDQMVAIAKWIEAEFEYKPESKLIATTPELLNFAKEMVKRYPNSPWIHEEANRIIKKAESL